MAKCFIFALVALIALQGALARPKKAEVEKSQIETLTSEAQQVVKKIGTSINENLDSETIVNNLKENTNKFATSVQSAVDDLNKQITEHKGDFDGVLNQVKESLTNAAEKLKTAIGPEATAKAQEIKDNLDKGFEKAIQDAEKLIKAAEPEATQIKTDVTNIAKNLLDKIVEVGKDVSKSLAEKPTKKH